MKLSMHEEALSGTEFASLSIKDTTKPCAYARARSSLPDGSYRLCFAWQWVKQTPSALQERAQAISNMYGPTTT